MQPSNVTFFVDQYKLQETAQQIGRKINVKQTVQTLSQAVNLLGPVNERFAVIEEHDRDGLEAYRQANFQVRSMNGDRDQTIHEVIQEVRDHLQFKHPRYMVAVTNDPVFHYLFRDLRQYNTELRVLVPGADIPPVFRGADYDVRLLSTIIPEPKPTRYAALVDYENIHIGLERNGISVSPKALMDAIKKKAAGLGDTGNIVAYADWDLLSRGSRYNIQRELALMSGVEPRYQPNENGKNSADMAIADQIRTVVEKPSGAPDAVDIIILCTGDRDFKPVVDTAKSRDKKVILFTVRGTLSAELREAADEVYYLDDLLKDQAKAISGLPKPDQACAATAMQFMALLKRHKWSFAYRNRLAGVLDEEQLRQALTTKVLTEQGPKVLPNFQHPLIQTANHLLDWIPWRISDALDKRNFSYVDSHYLINGMSHDRKLTDLGIGQNRQEAESWLELSAATGFIVKGTQPHRHQPEETVNTWSLPSQAATQPAAGKAEHSAEEANAKTEPETTEDKAEQIQLQAGSSSILDAHRRRLEKLQEREALEGIRADPSLIIEIEKIQTTIARLEQSQQQK